MGEEKGEKDVQPRDMPASTALKILGWRSNTPLKKCIYHGLCNLFFGVLYGMLLLLLH